MAVHHEFVDVEKLSKFASSKTQQFVSGALTSVAIIDYSPAQYNEIEEDIQNCSAFTDFSATLLASQRPDWADVRWVNVEGRNTAALRYALSCILEHPDLAFNSITAPKQRVKTHMWEEQKFFLLTKIPSLPEKPGDVSKEAHHEELLERVLDAGDRVVEYERIVFLLDAPRKTIYTFQAGKEGDVWGPLRESIKANEGGHHDVRKRGVSMLFWNLLSETLTSCDDIDQLFGTAIESIESCTSTGATLALKQQADALRHEIQVFRRKVNPLRDAFATMASDRFPTSVIPLAERVYFQDLFDQSQRIMDNISGHHDQATALIKVLENMESEKANKIQFIISMALAIFSPLSFITGLYGMNFAGDPNTGTGGMPELTWANGYTYLWLLLMGVILTVLILFVVMGVIPVPQALKPTSWMQQKQQRKGRGRASARK